MDVDLSLLTGFGEEEAFVDELLRHYVGRLPEAKNFALQNRVLLLRHSSGELDLCPDSIYMRLTGKTLTHHCPPVEFF
jgi:hypothetical protein